MKLKSFAAAAVACAGLVALAGTFAAPALADPPTHPNTVSLSGSDTTQDVIGAWAASLGGSPLTVGSWDATPVHTDISPKSSTACTNITRPNGSGEGLNALRRSFSSTSQASGLSPHPVALGAGCFDGSRSSSGPAANVVDPTAGLLIYVPFALDAVADATGPATASSGQVATKITHADSFTLANLQTLYRDCSPVTAGGVTYTPDGTVSNSTNEPIHLYVPQSGSGTRNFWASTLGFNATTLPTCVHDTSEVTGAAVEEHDGTVLAGDADGLAPFSIAQWISQFNGHNDRRHGAVIHSLNGISPFDPNFTQPVENKLYPITREVYNVIPYAAATSSTNILHNLFVTTSSSLCSASTTIQNYGFLTLDGTGGHHNCGDLDTTNLRAYNAANI